MQQQKQTQEQITKSQSLVLLKNMMRISISSICFHRGVFDEDCFKSKPYDGLPIHQLDTGSQREDGTIMVRDGEAFMLTQWLERGVFRVLEKEYLSEITFALCTRHPVSGEDVLLEKYDFRVNYGSEDQSPSINGATLGSKDDLKFQAKKFLRSLIAFVQTLDDLPKDRCLTILLKYADNAPQDFAEPEFFKECAHDALVFNGKPIRVKIGGVSTQYSSLSMTYAGIDSLMTEDTSLGDMRRAPQQVDGMFRASKQLQSPSKMNALAGNMESNLQLASATEETEIPVETQEEDSQQHSVYKLVRDYMLSQRRATIKACSSALNLEEIAVREAFQDLLNDHVIRLKGRSYQLTEEFLENTPTTEVLASASTRQSTSNTCTGTAATVVDDTYPHGTNVASHEVLREPPPAPRKNKRDTSAETSRGSVVSEAAGDRAKRITTTTSTSTAVTLAAQQAHMHPTVATSEDIEETCLEEESPDLLSDGPRSGLMTSNTHKPNVKNQKSALELEVRRGGSVTTTSAHTDKDSKSDNKKRQSDDMSRLSQASDTSEISIQGSVSSRYSIVREPIYQQGRIPKRARSSGME